MKNQVKRNDQRRKGPELSRVLLLCVTCRRGNRCTCKVSPEPSDADEMAKRLGRFGKSFQVPLGHRQQGSHASENGGDDV